MITREKVALSSIEMLQARKLMLEHKRQRADEVLTYAAEHEGMLASLAIHREMALWGERVVTWLNTATIVSPSGHDVVLFCNGKSEARLLRGSGGY